jgi:hypothetical protein
VQRLSIIPAVDHPSFGLLILDPSRLPTLDTEPRAEVEAVCEFIHKHQERNASWVHIARPTGPPP